MISMSLILHSLAVISVVFYLLASIYYIGLLRNEGAKFPLARFSLAFGFLTQLSFLCLVFILTVTDDTSVVNLQDWLIVGLPFILNSIGCALIATFLVLERKMRIEGLGALLVPLAMMLMIAAGLLFHFSSSGEGFNDLGLLVIVHITSTTLANVCFVFSFAVSVALVMQEHAIKNKRFGLLQRKLPSINLLDRLNSMGLPIGFLLLSIGMALGVVIILVKGLNLFHLDPLLLGSTVSLAIYGVLNFERVFHGWRGSRVAWLSIAGFATVMASYVGVYFFGESIHAY